MWEMKIQIKKMGFSQRYCKIPPVIPIREKKPRPRAQAFWLQNSGVRDSLNISISRDSGQSDTTQENYFSSRGWGREAAWWWDLRKPTIAMRLYSKTCFREKYQALSTNFSEVTMCLDGLGCVKWCRLVGNWWCFCLFICLLVVFFFPLSFSIVF